MLVEFTTYVLSIYPETNLFSVPVVLTYLFIDYTVVQG